MGEIIIASKLLPDNVSIWLIACQLFLYNNSPIDRKDDSSKEKDNVNDDYDCINEIENESDNDNDNEDDIDSDDNIIISYDDNIDLNKNINNDNNNINLNDNDNLSFINDIQQKDKVFPSFWDLVQLCQLLLVSLLVKDLLPLEARSLNLTSSDTPTLITHHFLFKLYGSINHLLEVPSSNWCGVDNIFPSFADIIDGRLFHRIVAYYRETYLHGNISHSNNNFFRSPNSCFYKF